MTYQKQQEQEIARLRQELELAQRRIAELEAKIKAED